MRYIVSNEFVPIEEASGTVQNTSKINIVEISDATVEGSGIMLYPMDRFTFNTPIYARCVDGGGAEVRVVPFVLDAKGGDTTISLTSDIIPSLRIRSDNGVEFAADLDLYPAVDILAGDTLYLGEHVFQFTGFADDLSFSDGNFYAGNTVVGSVSNYDFQFTDAGALSVADGDIISIAQLDGDGVNFSLDLDALNGAGTTGWGWRYANQASGTYEYKSSGAAIKYIKTDSASYTYNADASAATQYTFTITLANTLDSSAPTTGLPSKRFHSPITSDYKTINEYVKVEEIRDSSTGELINLKVTILKDAAIKNNNDWITEVSACENNYSVPTEIVFADGVATDYMYKREDGSLVEDSGTYTFKTDKLTEGYEQAVTEGNTIYKKTTIDSKASEDTCTISGLASGLKIHKTADYQYKILKGNEEVGTINGFIITLTSKDALASNWQTAGFTVKVVDNEYFPNKIDDGNYWYELKLSGDDIPTTVETTPAKFVKSGDKFTYTLGSTPAHFELTTNELTTVDGNELGGRTQIYTYTAEATVGDSTLKGLKLTGLGVSGDLTIDGNNIMSGETIVGTINTTQKTVTLRAAALPSNPDANTTTITLSNDDGYSLKLYRDVVSGSTPYRVYDNNYYDTYYATGARNGYGWYISDDGKSAICVAARGCGKINAGRPLDWVAGKNDSDEVFWSPKIYMTAQEYSELPLEEKNKYTHLENELYCYSLNSASAVKVADFDGETITVNHNMLDGRSLSNPLVLEPYYDTLGILKLDLATDNETAAISRNFDYETFTAGASAGTYTYAALSSTEGWNVSADATQILSVELEGKTFTLNNLRTDLGNLGFDNQGYIHATNGSTIGRMGGAEIKLFDTAVHKLATPTITGTDAADFTLILPT